ncbi:YybH family protein [Phytomonospora endophytica]|uniref:Ketosteroid isomerase-like protein n=1 Tax=Phytomonospora endophytica TaxID=714109 RepID=A0A841FAD4_9ACTN|nr:DUF4440 domain-containing protein [Phytomonospora endophytica]MBB6032714.1 ketosteroid isomerase-like protein [Phytomonospora endophytica]GIG66137.1 hypothetical protein Pen01_24320 [Phytomonospora endophytica]
MSVPRLEDLHARFVAHSNDGDAEALAALYEDGAVYHSLNAGLRRGGGIAEFFTEMLADRPRLEETTLRIVQAGDIALLAGEWKAVEDGPDGPVTTTGTSVEVARRQPDGGWLYVIDEPVFLDPRMRGR